MKSYETIQLPAINEDARPKNPGTGDTVKLPVVSDDKNQGKRVFTDTDQTKKFLEDFNQSLINRDAKSLTQQEFRDLNEAYKFSKSLTPAERITIQRRLKEISNTIHPRPKPEQDTN